MRLRRWGRFYGPLDWFARWRGDGPGISVSVVGADYRPIFSERYGSRKARYLWFPRGQRLRLEILKAEG